ncbi:MAG TPA: hydroxymethylbilane synthase [Chloroflexi bacterium]|nr:hydroxymethylbilane synthase [Chloroflexota bacterium]
MTTSIRLGTRSSQLALAQTHSVAAALRMAHPGLVVEIVTVRTSGDRRSESLREIGGQGAFTRELELALLDGEVDVAVHSLKDLPGTVLPGLVLAATPPREDERDVVISRDECTLAALPCGSRVGTGSLRRAAQLLRARPDLEIADIRGNVDTRLHKLDEGQYDAIVLAAAGLRRLGRSNHIGEYLPVELLLPAPGQAALGLECRSDDQTTQALLTPLNDAPTFAAVTAERAVLRAFGAGCRLPIAALGRVEGEQLTVHARVLNPAGTLALDVRDHAPSTEAEALGARVAAALLSQGAAVLLELQIEGWKGGRDAPPGRL